jgi:multidrug efflux system membrane fusion protein
MSIQANEKTAPPHWQPVPSRPSMFQRAPFLIRRVRIGKWLGGAALILVLGGFWYLNHHGIAEPRAPRGGAAAPVKVAKVQRQDMPVIERNIGTVVAYDTVQVTPQVAGRVVEALFKEGQMVKKGDLLFQIDPRPFEAALAQVRGQMTKDQAALDGARRDLKRFQALMAAGAESQQIVDDESATAAADAGIVEADQANLQTAELNLEYTKIRSPVDRSPSCPATSSR